MWPLAKSDPNAAPKDLRKECFAIVTPGLESFARQELVALGFTKPVALKGGVSFLANEERLFLANLWLRTATRILVRVSTFKTYTFYELEESIQKIHWESFLRDGSKVSIRVTSRQSQLYHTRAVAERFQIGLHRRFKGLKFNFNSSASEDADGNNSREGDGRKGINGFKTGDGSNWKNSQSHGKGNFNGNRNINNSDRRMVVQANSNNGEDNAAEYDGSQLITVRISENICTVSVDSSGDLLHRRGYRLITSKAPIRETLAAGCLLAIGYDGSKPLIDPMCGSGTFPIEAAMISRRIPPGRNRNFICETWPYAPRKKYQYIREKAIESILPEAKHPIFAFDRDAGAVQSTIENATRAGVAKDIVIRQQSISNVDEVVQNELPELLAASRHAKELKLLTQYMSTSSSPTSSSTLLLSASSTGGSLSFDDSPSAPSTSSSSSQLAVQSIRKSSQLAVLPDENDGPIGQLIVNPPYGTRIGRTANLRNLYAQLGNTLRKSCLGWELNYLCGNFTLSNQLRLREPLTVTSFRNGGVLVRLTKGIIRLLKK